MKLSVLWWYSLLKFWPDFGKYITNLKLMVKKKQGATFSKILGKET